VVRLWAGNHTKTPPQPDPPEIIGKTIIGGREYAMPKFAAVLPTPKTTGDFEEMCLAAGESVALTTGITTAWEVVPTIGRKQNEFSNGSDYSLPWFRPFDRPRCQRRFRIPSGSRQPYEGRRPHAAA
jgi:hypothetical protein